MNDEDFARIRRRMIALREGTGDMTREEVQEWLRAEMIAAITRDLENSGSRGLQKYGMLLLPPHLNKTLVELDER